MAFSAEGFFQGTAQAIPQAWHLYKEASLLPMQREAMQTQLAMSQLQLQKAKEAEAEMNRPYKVDYLMAQHGLDPETREGKAFNSFFSQFTDDKGTIYGRQFPAIKNVMDMTDFKTSLLKARMEDAQDVYETARDKYQKKMIKMKEEGYPGYKPDFLEQKKMDEEHKKLQMYQDRYDALSDQYYKTENRKLAAEQLRGEMRKEIEYVKGYNQAQRDINLWGLGGVRREAQNEAISKRGEENRKTKKEPSAADTKPTAATRNDEVKRANLTQELAYYLKEYGLQPSMQDVNDLMSANSPDERDRVYRMINKRYGIKRGKRQQSNPQSGQGGSFNPVPDLLKSKPSGRINEEGAGKG